MEDVLLLICVCLTFGTSVGSSPVYGFEGVMGKLSGGQSLHYHVRLNKCMQKTGIGFPEFAEPFGSHVTKWRSYNDQQAGKQPSLSFHEQIPVLNNKGVLVRLSRDIMVYSSNTTTVTTTIFRSDYGQRIAQYSHECTMSTANSAGDIDFKASDSEATRLTSVDDIVTSLQGGEYLHFNAMTFLCAGGVEHTFSGLGGSIPNYELVYSNLTTVNKSIDTIKFFVQTTVHYDSADDTIFAAIIDVSISRNHSVTIVDSRAKTPSYIPMSTSVLHCGLEFGPPGGTFTVFV